MVMDVVEVIMFPKNWITVIQLAMHNSMVTKSPGKMIFRLGGGSHWEAPTEKRRERSPLSSSCTSALKWRTVHGMSLFDCRTLIAIGPPVGRLATRTPGGQSTMETKSVATSYLSCAEYYAKRSRSDNFRREVLHP